MLRSEIMSENQTHVIVWKTFTTVNPKLTLWEKHHLQAILFAAGVFVHALVSAITFAKPLFNKIPYHTSILTGGWRLGTQTMYWLAIPSGCTQSLGFIVMSFAVWFLHCKMQVWANQNMFCWKKNWLYFYMPRWQGCQSGTLVEGSNILMKQFQSEYIPPLSHMLFSDSCLSSRCFQDILFTLSSPPFYSKYVYLPSDTTPIPNEIQNDPKFYSFFEGALGAIDGTHQLLPLFVWLSSSLHGTKMEASHRTAWHVALLIYIFSMCWVDGSWCCSIQWCVSDWFVCVGWKVLPSRCRLWSIDALLVPYWHVHYQLAEWGCVSWYGYLLLELCS